MAVDSTHITKFTKIFYSIGAMPYGIKDSGFSYFLLLFYSQVLGLSPALASLALAIAIFFDAISDPLVGYASDNLRSPWGRRHPFMYVAILPICLSYYWIWNPPEFVFLSQTHLFFYLLVMAIFIRLCLTFFEVPNTALISELTSDYDERTGLMGLRIMFGWLGGIGMAILAYAVFLRETDTGGGLLDASGYSNYGLAAASLMFIGMLLSSLGTHSSIRHLHEPPKQDRKSILNILKEIWDTTRNPSFRALFFSSIFSGTAAGMGTALALYFLTFFWGLTSSDLAIFTIGQLFAAVAATFAAKYLGSRFDKKHAAMGVFLFVICLSPSMLFLRLLDVLPENGEPILMVMLMVHNFFEVGCAITMIILVGSMMADVVEDSAVDTQRRSEGLLFAARGFSGKMVSGLGVMIAGLVLSWAELPRDAKPEDVSQEVLTDLVLYAIPIQGALYLTAIALIGFYKISRTQHEENVKVLASR